MKANIFTESYWCSVGTVLQPVGDRRAACPFLKVTEKTSTRQHATFPELGGLTEVWGFLLSGKSSWLATSVYKAK